MIIDNFMRYSTLDIAADFEENSHVSFEESSALATQLKYAVCRPCNIGNEDPVEYFSIGSESQLDPLAQKNKYCQRMFIILSPSEKCGEYQRDLKEDFPERDLTQYTSIKEFSESCTLTEEEQKKFSQYCERCQKEYTEKRKILVRAICDFISGMTDTYALNEYRRLEY